MPTTVILPVISDAAVVGFRLYNHLTLIAEVAVAKNKSFGGLLNETPETNVVPEGMYLCKIIKITEKHSKAGKLMFAPQLQILEPKSAKGQMLFENYVIGTDEDPEGTELATYKSSFGARNYAKMLRKAGVEVKDDDDSSDVCSRAEGHEIMVSVTQQEEKEGDYKGQIRNRIAECYEPGEREAKITGEAPKPKKDKPAEVAEKKVDKKPAKKTTKKPAEDDDDDDEEEDDDDDDDDEDDDDED